MKRQRESAPKSVEMELPAGALRREPIIDEKRKVSYGLGKPISKKEAQAKVRGEKPLKEPVDTIKSDSIDWSALRSMSPKNKAKEYLRLLESGDSNLRMDILRLGAEITGKHTPLTIKLSLEKMAEGKQPFPPPPPDAAIAKQAGKPKRQGVKGLSAEKQSEFKAEMDALKNITGRMGSGLDKLEALPHLMKLGALTLEAGYKDFKSWSAYMIAHVGEAYSKFMKELWDKLHEAPKGEVASGKREPLTAETKAMMEKVYKERTADDIPAMEMTQAEKIAEGKQKKEMLELEAAIEEAKASADPVKL
jgi:hypothetical protein